MKSFLFILCLIPCLSMAQNQLIGEWHYDSERTLSELDLTSEYSKKIKKCYEVNMCGDGFIVFDEKSYVFTQSMTSKDITIEGTRSYYNYKVVGSNSGSITIIQKPIDYVFYSEQKGIQSKKKVDKLNVLFKKANNWEADEDIEAFETKFFLTDDSNSIFLLFPEGQKEYFYRKIKQ